MVLFARLYERFRYSGFVAGFQFLGCVEIFFGFFKMFLAKRQDPRAPCQRPALYGIGAPCQLSRRQLVRKLQPEIGVVDSREKQRLSESLELFLDFPIDEFRKNLELGKRIGIGVIWMFSAFRFVFPLPSYKFFGRIIFILFVHLFVHYCMMIRAEYNQVFGRIQFIVGKSGFSPGTILADRVDVTYLAYDDIAGFLGSWLCNGKRAFGVRTLVPA